MKHRFIIIGPGNISEKYVHAIKAMNNASLVGVVGRSEARLKTYADKFGIEHWGTRLADVAKASQATAAIVCTPNGVHDEAVIEAASLGLHCMCEKPLHIALAAQEKMLEACRRHGVKLGVSYMRRFFPHILYLKQLVDEGAFGRITAVDVTFKHYRTKEYYDSWHGTVAMDGGGPFIQQGSHIVDMALWLNDGYEEIYDAKMFQILHDIETEDHGYGILRYGNGAVGMMTASTACPGMVEERIEITGELGSAAVSYEKFLSFNLPGKELPEFKESGSLFQKLLEDFVQAIEEDREPLISGESGALTTKFVLELYEKAGRPIRTIK